MKYGKIKNTQHKIILDLSTSFKFIHYTFESPKIESGTLLNINKFIEHCTQFNKIKIIINHIKLFLFSSQFYSSVIYLYRLFCYCIHFSKTFWPMKINFFYYSNMKRKKNIGRNSDNFFLGMLPNKLNSSTCIKLFDFMHPV